MNKVYDLSKESKNNDDRITLISAFYVILDMLSEEDSNKIQEEFKLYMNDCNKKGINYTPAYLWTLQKIKVSI